MALGVRAPSASGRPLAWLSGLALILLALFSLQLDRVSNSSLTMVAAIDSALIDPFDDGKDDAPSVDGDGLFHTLPVSMPALTRAVSTSVSSNDTRANRIFASAVSARGPPLTSI